ncbi:MAG: glycosyl transferase family 2 [Bacteroidetes bacterium GWF2_33_16]|nr:MAG: glycosyl transferase family 2 [Bacteroidetes bacterium GWE2_32_14]OFY07849.1 MAG: glycosyl transferase family 2 [Bacteroidetes bacterium GWF2_33_16]
MAKTAIVILNWNGKKFLSEFLPILINNSRNTDSEIIIADNDSKDDSIAFLNLNYPEIRQIILDKNYGFAGGYNRALSQVDAQYFVLLNSDVEVTPNWLNPLTELLDSNLDVAAVMPKIRSINNRNEFEYAGAAGGFIDKYGYPFCRGRIIGTVEIDSGQYNDVIDIFWATGACMVIRGDLYKQVGGFDDDFFAHMEEIDLCWRLKNLGHRIVCCPNSIVYHVGGGTLPNNNPFKLYLNYRNNLFLLYKNLPTKNFKLTLFKRLLLDGISSALFLAKLSFSSFNAVIKAHLHFYKSLPDLKQKRKEIIEQSKVVQLKEIYNRSIVFDYFINKKKFFSQLRF